MTAATIFRALNRIVVPLLRSPLHRLASRQLMVITYPGRRSGRTYTFAIGYFPWADGQVLSFSSRSWWTNLLGGATARLLLRGRWHEATATVVRRTEGKADLLGEFTARNGPAAARRLRLGLPGNRQPTRDELLAAAVKTTLIRFRLVDGTTP